MRLHGRCCLVLPELSPRRARATSLDHSTGSTAEREQGMSDEQNYCEDCNNARKKFRKGDRVVLSLEGFKRIPEFISRKFTGRVVGFSRIHRNCVLIRFRYLKEPQSLHCGFWERP